MTQQLIIDPASQHLIYSVGRPTQIDNAGVLPTRHLKQSSLLPSEENTSPVQASKRAYIGTPRFTLTENKNEEGYLATSVITVRHGPLLMHRNCPRKCCQTSKIIPFKTTEKRTGASVVDHYSQDRPIWPVTCETLFDVISRCNGRFVGGIFSCTSAHSSTRNHECHTNTFDTLGHGSAHGDYIFTSSREFNGFRGTKTRFSILIVGARHV